eukprot:9108679-Pyramimonas_sp.AAC.1
MEDERENTKLETKREVLIPGTHTNKPLLSHSATGEFNLPLKYFNGSRRRRTTGKAPCSRRSAR